MTVFSFIFLFLTFFSSAQCTTFENVTLFLTSRWTKLYIHEKPATNTVFIEKSDTLGEYVNLQPLEILKIQNQNVPKLRASAVSNLPNIMDIELTSSGLKEIEPGSFYNIPKVDYLNLSHNALEEIRDGVFNNLNLISLFLQHNKISILGDSAFNNMTLKHLLLDHNKISVWNSDWFKGTALGSIFMSDNLLEELPANAFDYYVKLNSSFRIHFQTLILNNNKLKKIDQNAFKGVEVFGYLGLKNNSLEKLASEVFHTVKYIDTLELSDNNISNVDEALKNTVIIYLRLKNNNLSCFPVEIFNVTRIHHLTMDGNPVTCNCVRTFENWKQQSQERIVYLEKARRTCID